LFVALGCTFATFGPNTMNDVRVITVRPMLGLTYKIAIGKLGLTYKIAIGKSDDDPVSQGIASSDYELPNSIQLMLAAIKPGSVVIDIGAHIGTFAIPAAALGYHVIAVEASSRNVELLRTSLSLNGFTNVQVVQAAVSDREGIVEFFEMGPYGGIVTPRGGGPTVSQVTAVTVDSLLASIGLKHVDFIKMDIEGSEVKAIHGMSDLLSQPEAPAIVYESNGHTLQMFNETPQSLIAALDVFGYKSYLTQQKRLVPVEINDLQPECVVDYLAAKQLVGKWRDWVITSMTQEEQLSLLLVESCVSGGPNRAYVARTLASANRSFLSDPRIRAALDRLCMDEDPTVRDAASWWLG